MDDTIIGNMKKKPLNKYNRVIDHAHEVYEYLINNNIKLFYDYDEEKLYLKEKNNKKNYIEYDWIKENLLHKKNTEEENEIFINLLIRICNQYTHEYRREEIIKERLTKKTLEDQLNEIDENC